MSSWVGRRRCPLPDDLAVYTSLNDSWCHLGLFGGIRAALPASWKNNPS